MSFPRAKQSSYGENLPTIVSLPLWIHQAALWSRTVFSLLPLQLHCVAKTEQSRIKELLLTENLAENSVHTAEFFAIITQEVQRSMAFSIATADV